MSNRLPPQAPPPLPRGEEPPSKLEALKGLFEQSPFLSLETKGLFVNLEKLNDAQAFRDCVQQIFQGGHYLTGLSYKNLAAILYQFPAVKAQYPRLRLADGLAPLLDSREALYQGELAANSHQAEYDFTLKVDSRAAFTQGEPPPSAEDAPRSLDEFVAVLWKKGIRFGLDLEAIKQGLAVAKNQLLKLVVARASLPQPGTNARLDHLISLEKDLRPLETPDGQVDLRRYLCVFPQAKQGQVILRRIPPTPGIEGHNVFGEAIPPEQPGQDLSLEDLLGAGVALAQAGKYMCLVATHSGFVSVHPQSGVISITDEVINHIPVGIQTGSLRMEAERCLQFGGVSPGYSLEGRNLELQGGRVEGGVLSRQGNVNIQGDVAGGQVTALAGDIVVKGKVMAGSRLEACAGSISVEKAENCLLIGKLVTTPRAVNANIISEQAVIAEVEGSRIFSFSAKIDRITTRRPREGEAAMESGGTTLTVPMIEPPRRPAVIIERTIEALTRPLPELEAHIQQIGGNQTVQLYLRALVTYQTAKNEEQAAKAMSVFHSLEEKVMPVVERWRNIKEERQRILIAKDKLEAELQVWKARIRRLEEDLQGAMQLTVGSVADPNSFLKLYHDPRLPESFAEVAAMEPARRKQLEALCLNIITSPSLGHAKERTLPLDAPLKSSYRELRTLLDQAEDKPSQPLSQPLAPPDQGPNHRRESRLLLLSPDDFLTYLGDPEYIPPAGRLLLSVKVDEILQGFVSDLTGLGMAVVLDHKQRYSPVFMKDDKVSLEFSVGSLGMRLEMVAVFIEERGRMVRLGGFFVNLPPALQANLYKIKNALEARLKAVEA